LSSLVVLPEADKILKRTPLYETHQLKPIARFTADPTVLVVRADSPWKTYADFIAYAKANPGRISFGSSGNYGTMHVPYTGAGPAVLSLLGGQIEALSTGPASVKQHIASGRLRALAHWGDGRLASMPTVPSFKELGVPIQSSQWSGLFVPADTPPAVVDSLRQAAKFAAQDPRAVAALTASGTSFMYQDAPEFERFVQADAKDMSALVIRIGKVD
jgi:tripartite-type tricarboxylate transporter receptor subunit TctC